MKPPKELYVIWPKPGAKRMFKELERPDAFITRKQAEVSPLLEDEIIVAYSRSSEEQDHKGSLHAKAVRWLADRANPETDGGLGVFADTRFCLELEALLKKVDAAARRDCRRKMK